MVAGAIGRGSGRVCAYNTHQESTTVKLLRPYLFVETLYWNFFTVSRLVYEAPLKFSYFPQLSEVLRLLIRLKGNYLAPAKLTNLVLQFKRITSTADSTDQKGKTYKFSFICLYVHASEDHDNSSPPVAAPPRKLILL